MSKMFVKSGDTVQVLSGKSKGVRGEVVAVSPAEGKVIVKKVNVVTVSYTHLTLPTKRIV